MSKEKEVKTSKIWDEIKNKQISLFALPPRALSEYVEPNLDLSLEDSLYVKQKAPGVIVLAIEEALGPSFEILVQENKWVLIKRVAPKLNLG
jgi:hypothetical protein